MAHLYKDSIKCTILFAICCVHAATLCAQVKPTTQTTPSTTTRPLKSTPAAYNIATGNIIRAWDAEKPFSVDSMLTSNNRTVLEVKQTTQYFDGLGRPIQTVVKGISPNGYDMVSAQIYDGFGREQFKYLSYVSATSDGNFKLNTFSEQNSSLKSFYNPTNATNGEKFFYSETAFEPSPLNRADTVFAAGNSWVGRNVGI